MSVSNSYGNVIWTNHALERLNQRGLSQEMAWQTFKNPQTSAKEKQNTLKFERKFQSSTVTVVAKQNDKREWVILSAWIHPPLLGTSDYTKQNKYKDYQKSSGIKKFLLTFKQQLGF